MGGWNTVWCSGLWEEAVLWGFVRCGSEVDCGDLVLVVGV